MKQTNYIYLYIFIHFELKYFKFLIYIFNNSDTKICFIIQQEFNLKIKSI